MIVFQQRIGLMAALLLMSALILAIYWPGMSGGLIFDDFHAIHNNPAVQIKQLDLEHIRQAFGSFSGGLSGRGLTMVSFGMDYWFWRGDLFGHKLSNVLLHVLNAMLVFLLITRLFQLGKTSSHKDNWPVYSGLFLALVWAIHPLQVSTVLYVVQRMETMAVFFILCGLLMYIRGRRLQLEGNRNSWCWLAGSGLAGCLAFLAKETGVLLPMFTLCLELTILKFAASQEKDRKILISLYIIGLAIALFIFLFYFLPPQLHQNAFSGRHFDLVERLLTQFRALTLYLSWIVWPDPQRYLFFYDAYPISTGWLKPWTTLVSAIFLAGLLITAFVYRNRVPLFALGVLWFFTAHLLTSNIFSLELIFEHRNYFALLGVLLAIAELLRRLPVPSWVQLPRRSLAIALIAGMTVLTLIHSATWGDSLNLAMDLKAKNPESARAGYRLGQVYLGMADGTSSAFFGFARNEFERARRLDRASPMSERMLLEMNAISDEVSSKELWDSLINKVENGPASSETVKAVRDLLEAYNRGVELDEDRLMDAGIALLNQPGNIPYNYWEFGVFAIEELGDSRLATQIFEAGAQAANAHAWNQQVVEALSHRGHTDFSEKLGERLENIPTTGESARASQTPAPDESERP